MSRAVWFVAGASAGVYAMNKARQFAGTLNAEGLRARWEGITHGVRLVAQDAKQAQVQREDELRERMGLPAARIDRTRQLSAPAPSRVATPTRATPVENDQKDIH
jgi:hypothetical protein